MIDVVGLLPLNLLKADLRSANPANIYIYIMAVLSFLPIYHGTLQIFVMLLCGALWSLNEEFNG